MATTRNIQMQYYNGTDYDVLYPMANYQNMVGTPPGISGDLSFSDISGTVSTSQLPTVPINKGGTGATSASQARSNLGITPGNIGAAASSHNHSASNITSGTLPLTRGGTGATSASGAVGSLTYGATTTGSLSNSYYFPCASSSSTGRRVGLDTLGNYIMNTFGGSGGGLSYKTGSYTGTGTNSVTIQIGASFIAFYLTEYNPSRMNGFWTYKHCGIQNYDELGSVYTLDFIFFVRYPGMKEISAMDFSNYSGRNDYAALNNYIDMTETSLTITEDNRVYNANTGGDSSSSLEDISDTIFNRLNDTYKWVAITY